MLFSCGFLNINYQLKQLDGRILRGSPVGTQKASLGEVQDICILEELLGPVFADNMG